MSEETQPEPGPSQHEQPGPAAPPPGTSWPPPQAGSGAPAYPQPGYPAYPPPPASYPTYPYGQQPGYGMPPGAGYPVPPQHTALPAFPHAEPMPYHQMLRTWTYRWWKPALGIVLSLFAGFVLAPLVLMPVLALGVLVQSGSSDFLTKFLDAATLQKITPAALLYLNLVLGSLILITWFMMRVIHRMRPRWLASVVPKLRWRFLFVCMGIAVVALVAQLVVGTLVPGDTSGDFSKLNSFTTSTAVLALVVFLTTPLQAAGEEYLFRGYLLQGFGSLFRNRTVAKWVAIVVTATLFAFAHGGQNFPLFFDRFMFGLIAGWLVVRTGGLEAGIALHILNNFLAYAVALAFGDVTQTLTVSQASWWNIPVTLTQSLLYAGLVAFAAHRMGLQTRTRPPVEPVHAEPVPAAV